MFFLNLALVCFLVIAKGQTIVYSQSFTDTACTIGSGVVVSTVVPASGTTCGTVLGTTLVATVSGTSLILSTCTACNAAGTACTGTQGALNTVAWGTCALSSLLGGTGSFSFAWGVTAATIFVQGYSDNSCATVSGTCTSSNIAVGGTCGTLGGLTGLALLNGGAGVVAGCTCASATSCGTAVLAGAAVRITLGACTPGSLVGQSGSFIASATGCPGSSNPCFHKDTIITYAGKDHTFDEIGAHPECSIPHVVRAHGVVVTAKCGAAAEKTLRLTDGHLVYTQRGLQAAGDLKPRQDTVYADIAETTKCQVVSVTKETQQHDYFGLNCLNSQVLASGLKSSTFEKLHSVPAFWMQIMGRVLGIKRASQLGDYIAELVQKMNLI